MAMFISILSGYLIIAYLAGINMTRSQVVIVNTLYILLMILMMAAMFSITLRANEMAMLSFQMSSQRTISPHGFMPLIAVIFFFFCTIASLKFMWDVRHPDDG